MATPREIHRHMKSVQNIQQITKAMKMVAAARLRRAQEKAASSRPFADKIRELLISAVSDKEMLAHLNYKEHPLLEVRPVKNVAYVVVSADNGLAGAYNSNVLKFALAHLMEEENPVIVTVGRKAKDFFTRRGFNVEASYFGFSDKPTYNEARTIAAAVSKMFVEGKVDEVKVIYTKFKSALSFSPDMADLLPVVPPSADTAADADMPWDDDEPRAAKEDTIPEIIFEPEAEQVLKALVPYYAETVLYAGFMQSAASELGARMTAMSSATDNASKLMKTLELSYNKARQAGITREISEIVGGAEALQ